VEVFLAGKTLAEHSRAANGAGFVNDQAPIRLVWESDLGDGPNQDRVEPATNDGEDERGDDGATDSRE
jgi:hypothetical protein